MTNAPLNSNHKRLIDDAVEAAFGRAEWTLEEILAGGLSTANLYKITVSEQVVVVRISDPGHPHHQLEREYAAMKLAAESHIAPAVFYANGQTGVLLMAFVAARPIPPLNLDAPQQIERLARFVHELHQLPDFPPDDPVAGKLDGLLALCLPAVQANGLVQRCMVLKERLAQLLADEGDKRPSHADINPTNLLYDGSQLWLIDWAAATQQSFYFDLACAGLFFFYQNETAYDVFLQAYLQRPPTPEESRKYYLMRLFVSIYYGLIFIYLGTQNEPNLLTQSEVDTLPAYAQFMQLIGEGKENIGNSRSQQKLGFIYLKTALAAHETGP